MKVNTKIKSREEKEGERKRKREMKVGGALKTNL